MSYGYTKELQGTFSEAIERTKAALKQEGFGILTEIDVQATLKEKINVDSDRYTILGACNPKLAHQAMLTEREIGLMLPCNIILYEHDGTLFVSVILPTVAMKMINNKELQEVAKIAEGKLIKVIDAVAAPALQ